MADQQDILESYIKHLLDVQDQQRSWLTEADLKQTALELGLSEEDLQRIDREAEACRQRGNGYMQHGHWSDAVNEYRQAVALKPLDVSLVYTLADAYKHRWSATGNETDRAEAERCLRQCISIDPNHSASFELLAQVRKPTEPSGSRLTPAKRRAITAGIALMALLILVLMVLSRRMMPNTNPPVPQLPERVTEAPTAPFEGADGARASLPAELPSEWEVPVELMPDKAGGLQLILQQSLMKNYADSYSHTLRAGLVSEADEIHRLSLRLDLIGEADKVLESHTFDARSEYQAYIRPGDVLPVSNLTYEEAETPRVVAARLYVDIIERQPAPDTYAEPEPVELIWEAEPGSTETSLFERESRVSEASLLKTWSHHLTLEIQNSGGRLIKKLQIRIDWLDDAGQVIGSDTSYLITSTGPGLMPGEQTVHKVIQSFPDSMPRFDRYTIAVVDVE